MSLRGEEFLRVIKNAERHVRHLLEGYQEGKTDAAEFRGPILDLSEDAITLKRGMSNEPASAPAAAATTPTAPAAAASSAPPPGPRPRRSAG